MDFIVVDNNGSNIECDIIGLFSHEDKNFIIYTEKSSEEEIRIEARAEGEDAPVIHHILQRGADHESGMAEPDIDLFPRGLRHQGDSDIVQIAVIQALSVLEIEPGQVVDALETVHDSAARHGEGRKRDSAQQQQQRDDEASHASKLSTKEGDC